MRKRKRKDELEFIDVEQQLQNAADRWVAEGMRPMPWHVPVLDVDVDPTTITNGLLHPIRVIKGRRLSYQVNKEFEFFTKIYEDPKLNYLWQSQCAAIGWASNDYSDGARDSRENMRRAIYDVVWEARTRDDAEFSKLATKLLKVMRDQNKYVYILEQLEEV